MLKEYTREQLQKLYKKLPEELQDAIYSKETADSIYDICERNNIEEKSIVAKLVGRVLLGILAPDEFQEAIEKELKLSREKAKEVAWEVSRFIFYPVRIHLEKLYQIEITPFPTTPFSVKKEKPKIDKYREPIE